MLTEVGQRRSSEDAASFTARRSYARHGGTDMARYSERDTTAVYEAADRLRERCLRKDGSLLFDDATLWNQANLAQLHKAFNAAPDEGDRNFLPKYRDQLQPAGQSVTRLGAEMLAIYLLFPTGVGSAKKRATVTEVLSWGGDTLSADHPISRAFTHGVGSGGPGYNMRRPFELAFLIDFAIAFKSLPADQREHALSDAWAFQEVVDSVNDVSGKQLRDVLLHLLFPEHFERIASGAHKVRIIRAFTGLVAPVPEDDDRHIHAIRGELEKLLPHKKLDFYWPPLQDAWHDESEAERDFGDLDIIEHKKQVVFYGPPGTGKTFRAKRLAERLIRSSALKKWGAARYFREQEEVERAIKTHYRRVQIHPAYSYEDFVGGLHVNGQGATEYRLGYLADLIRNTIEQEDRATRLPYVVLLDEINRTDLSRMFGECFSLLEDRNEAVDLPARDAAGKPLQLTIPDDLYFIGTMNLIDQSVEQIDFALRRRFLWELCPFSRTAMLAALRHRWVRSNMPVEWDRVEADFVRLGAAAEKLNHEIHISEVLGPQYEIGHTYFLDSVAFLRDELGGKARNRKAHLWTKDGPARPVELLWRLSLQPLVREYLAGLDRAVCENELVRLRKVFLEGSVAE